MHDGPKLYTKDWFCNFTGSDGCGPGIATACILSVCIYWDNTFFQGLNTHRYAASGFAVQSVFTWFKSFAYTTLKKLYYHVIQIHCYSDEKKWNEAHRTSSCVKIAQPLEGDSVTGSTLWTTLAPLIKQFWFTLHFSCFRLYGKPLLRLHTIYRPIFSRWTKHINTKANELPKCPN